MNINLSTFFSLCYLLFLKSRSPFNKRKIYVNCTKNGVQTTHLCKISLTLILKVDSMFKHFVNVLKLYINIYIDLNF